MPPEPPRQSIPRLHHQSKIDNWKSTIGIRQLAINNPRSPSAIPRPLPIFAFSIPYSPVLIQAPCRDASKKRYETNPFSVPTSIVGHRSHSPRPADQVGIGRFAGHGEVGGTGPQASGQRQHAQQVAALREKQRSPVFQRGVRGQWIPPWLESSLTRSPTTALASPKTMRVFSA